MGKSGEKPKRNGDVVASIKRTALILVLVFLIIYLLSIVLTSENFFNESASRSALLRLETSFEAADNLIDEHYDNLYAVAEQLQYAESDDEVKSVIGSYVGVDYFGDLRYYTEGKAFDSAGREVYIERSEQINELAAGQRPGSTDVYYDEAAGMGQDCIALFVPVRGSVYVSGVLSILPARNLIDLSEVIDDKNSAAALIVSDGRVLANKCREDFAQSLGRDFFSYIAAFTGSEVESGKVRDAFSSLSKTTVSIEHFGAGYTIAITPVESLGGEVLLVTLSESTGLIDSEMTYIRHIITVLVIAVLALAVALIIFLRYQKQSKRAIANATYIDTNIGCANAEQFKRVATEAVYSDKNEYAVIVSAIRQYRYVADVLGDAKTNELLRLAVNVIGNFTNGSETFGYAGDGKFLLLYKYTSEKAVKEKLRLVEGLVNKNAIVVENELHIKLVSGVYYTKGSKRRTVAEMIDCATLASETAISNVNVNYLSYTEQVRDEIKHNERIEAMMEQALANNDFKLFLQPKYNVANDRIDSAEALVRWFNPEKGEYMFPGEFIGLFETNGFIVKLDHFIYLEVLEYLSHSAEKGDPIVPISVNVSRVTAASPDFLDFYVGNKKKYGVGDGFITLEFTESFAMENYDKILDIVTNLHEHGMYCSIDDFGSGYSSFNILKNIPMDELKLDRFFLAPGSSAARDEKILEMVVALGKSIDMKVVQEGVENKDMFDRSVAMGLDVIQGYYYAKAIPIEEYKLFVKSNTSIKYKSIVK